MFCIVKVERKKLLVRVHRLNDDGSYDVVMPDNTLQNIPAGDVMANLGSNPEYGRVYGVLVAPLYKKVEVGGFGLVCLYRKDSWAEVKEAVIYAKGLLKYLGFEPEAALTFKFMPPRGKKLGWFAYSKVKSDAKLAEISLFTKEGTPVSMLKYVLAHEIGHWFWTEKVPVVARKKWVSLFLTYSRIVEERSSLFKEAYEAVEEEANAGIHETFGSLRSALADRLEEDVFIAASRGLDIAGSVYRLKDFDDLPFGVDGVTEFLPSLKEVWPKQLLPSSIYDIAVTPYAMTNQYEMFAESFAHWVFGYKLPEAVELFMSKVIKASKPKATNLDLPSDDFVM